MTDYESGIGDNPEDANSIPGFDDLDNDRFKTYGLTPEDLEDEGTEEKPDEDLIPGFDNLDNDRFKTYGLTIEDLQDGETEANSIPQE